MILNIRSFILPIVFLFTLKFELLNNLILLSFILFYFDQIKLKVRSTTTLIFPILILLIFFAIFNNINILKYCIYAFRFLFLLFFAEKILAYKELNLRKILEKIFYIHTITIIVCYFFSPINNIFKSIFSYSSSSVSSLTSVLDVYDLRVTGFIQGFEFVPFIIVIYLAYEYLIINKILSNKFIIKLLLGSLACLFSGRYSVVPLFVLFVFILYNKKFFFIKISLALMSSFVLIQYFDKIILNNLNTLKIIYDFIVIGKDADFSSFGQEAIHVSGQYNLSPITLLNEILIPFLNWKNHIFPSFMANIDPGPSYMFLNLGFIFTVFLYVFFFKSIKIYTQNSIPFIVVLIFLSIDFKFRSLYVLFPTVWLIINHINYVNFIKNENTLLYKSRHRNRAI